ncbi:MAG: bifunctional DNA primase/polymerase [Hyphomicrobiaceae bacterium]
MSPNGKARSDDDGHLDAALGYLKRGWAVVPAGERAKRPIVPWQAYQHRIPGEAEVTAWFERWPTANLAVITGAISGLVVVDIDPKNDGDQLLAALEARHGALPATVEAITGGGGRHIYFRHPGREVRNRVGLAPGIDLRGDGGCIIVPPSVHPSGKRYRWKPGHAPGQVDLASLPVWLEQSRFLRDGPRGHSAGYWRELVHKGVEEGQRNSTIASFAGHLLWHGVDPDVVLELMLAWNAVRCRPPLGDEEVIRTVESIERTHAQKS